jgi:hypothetical protein
MLAFGSALAGPVNITPSMGNREATPGPGPLNGAPSLDFNFVANPTLDPRITFTRSSSANYFDATGTLQSAATNTPRIDYGPTVFTTNLVRNSTNVGAAVGTPGTAPTNVGLTSPQVGLNRSIVTFATENNHSYIDVRYSGTASGTSVSIDAETAGGIVAVQGQTFTYSVDVTLVGGSLAGVTGVTLVQSERNGAGTQVGSTNGTAFNVATETGSNLAANRQSLSATMANATTASVIPRVAVGVTNGAAIDFTLRIGAPQVELGTVANKWIPTSTVAVSAPADSEGVTNWIRNSTLVGLVAADGVERVTNGSFALNPINAAPNTVQNGWSWVVTAGGLTPVWNGSLVTLQGDGTNKSEIDVGITTVVGATYTVTVDVGGAVMTGRAGTSVTNTNLGTFGLSPGAGRQFQFTATTTTSWVGFSTVSATPSTIDNVSIQSAGKPPTNSFLGITAVPGIITTVGTPITVSGIPVFPITLAGTATGTNSFTVQFDSNVVAFTGQSWAGSLYVQLVSGTFTATPALVIDEMTAANVFLTRTSASLTVTGALNRFPVTRTLNQATVGLARLMFSAGITTGDVVNVTFYIGAPQLELGVVANTWVPTSGAVANAGAVPLGLLIEEARINQVRNPRGEGVTIADGVERATNGTFALNPVNAAQNTLQNGWQWSTAGGTSGVALSGTTVQITGDGTNLARFETPITTVVGTVYTITATVQSAGTGVQASTLASLGGTQLLNTVSAVGATPQQFQFTAATTTTWVGFTKTSASVVNLTNVSIQSAGKVPPNWTLNLPTGVIVSVVASGTESGIPYVDVRYTAPAAAAQFFTYHDNAMATTAGNTVAYSVNVKLVAGSLTNIASMTLGIQFAGGAGNANAALAPVSGSLANQRVTAIATAGTGVTSTSVALAMTFTGAGDITLRHGAPQFEVGPFATSPILPPVSSPAAVTRQADLATMPVGSWFNATNMTLAADAMLPATSTPQQGLMLIDDGSVTNRITFRYAGGGPPVSIAAVVASATTYNIGTGSVIAGTPFKTAAAINPSGASISFNGATPASSAGATPSGLTTFHLGQNATNSGLANGYLRRLRYWPRTLSNAELQVATS